MKKVLIVLLAVLLTACGAEQIDASQRRNEALRSYADQFDAWYPDADQNISAVCLDDPGPIFEMGDLTAYTCVMPNHPGTYGVVTFDSSQNVLDAFTVRANSDGELTIIMKSVGWK